MTEFRARLLSDEAGERAFVAKSWVESFSSSEMARLISHAGSLGNPHGGWRASQEYWSTWNPLVDALLARARTTVLLDDAGLIAAFICWEPWEGAPCVHYVYVRLMYRRQRLASRLVGELPRGLVYYTHRSRGVTKIPDGWVYTLRPLIGAVRAEEAQAA